MQIKTGTDGEMAENLADLYNSLVMDYVCICSYAEFMRRHICDIQDPLLTEGRGALRDFTYLIKRILDKCQSLDVISANIDDLKEYFTSRHYAKETQKETIDLRPERNCEHYKTADEAMKAFQKFCDAHYQSKSETCDTCPIKHLKGGCFGHFLYAEYKPEVKQ